MDVVIVSADARTLDHAVELLKRQLEEHDIVTAEDDLRQVTRKVIEEPHLGFILLALSAEEFTGIVYAAAHLSAEHGGVIGWLEELFVTPESRGRGVGSALIHETIERAHQMAWRALELEVVSGHERAVPLYQRHDFVALSRTRFSRIFNR